MVKELDNLVKVFFVGLLIGICATGFLLSDNFTDYQTKINECEEALGFPENNSSFGKGYASCLNDNDLLENLAGGRRDGE